MWLPYSKYHGSRTFLEMAADLLFGHFGSLFGTLSGPLGVQMAPRRRKKGVPETHEKTTSLKAAKSVQNGLQKGLTKITF